MNDKWYAVPGYRGESQHGEIRGPHVVDAAGQLVCVCEGLDIAERIADDHNTLRHGTPDNIADIGPTAANLPVDAPPLPDGAVYGGRLGDYPYNTRLTGWRWYRGCDDWVFGEWRGMAGKSSNCSEWHYAKLANVERGGTG